MDPRKQEEPLKSGKAKAKARVEERAMAREKASHATCAEGLGTPQGRALCEGWVNDLEEDAPEDTNKDGC